MFLAAVAERGLLEPDHAQGALQRFPVEAQRALCATVVRELHDATAAGGDGDGASSTPASTLTAAATVIVDTSGTAQGGAGRRSGESARGGAAHSSFGAGPSGRGKDAPGKPGGKSGKGKRPTHDGLGRLRDPEHVAWAMEVLGTALALPLTEAQDVDACSATVDIYERWLGLHGKKGVPPVVAQHESRFMLVIFDHLNLLLGERAGLTAPALQSHVRLVHRTLNILGELTKSRGDVLSVEAWERLLSLMLGAADALLSRSEDGVSLGNEVQLQLIRVLLGLFLRSGTRNGRLWDLLQTYARNWTRRLSLVQQWYAAVVSLTRRVQKTLWTHTPGQPEHGSSGLSGSGARGRRSSSVGTQSGTVRWALSWADAETDIFEMGPSQIVYVWFRLLHLIGAPSNIKVAEVHSEYLNGLATLTDGFVDVGQDTVVPTTTVVGRPRNASFKESASARRQALRATMAQRAASERVPKARGGVASTPTPAHLRESESDSAGETELRSTRSLTVTNATQGATDSGTGAEFDDSEGSGQTHKTSFAGTAGGAGDVVASFARVRRQSMAPLGAALAGVGDPGTASPATPAGMVRMQELEQGDLGDSGMFDLGDAGDSEGDSTSGNDGGSDSALPAPPTGNDILRIFGAWLFDAAACEDPAFSLGRATALSALGRIFCSDGCRGRPFYGAHLVRFYQCVKAALQSRDERAVAAVVCSCCGIFGHNMDGCRLLVPSFLPVMDNILKMSSADASPFAERASDEDDSRGASFGDTSVVLLRRASIVLLASLLCLPNNFSVTKSVGLFFSEQTDHVVSRAAEAAEAAAGAGGRDDSSADSALAAAKASVPEQLKPLGAPLRGALNRMLVDALKTEEDALNAQTLLWALCTKVLEDAYTAPGIAQITIHAVVSRLEAFLRVGTVSVSASSMPPWAPSVVAVALRVLGSMASVAGHIHRSSTATIPTLVRRLVALALAGLREIRATRGARAHLDRITSTAIHAVLDWVLWHPPLVTMQDVAREIIALALEGADRGGHHHSQIVHADAQSKGAALRLLQHLQGVVGRLPAGAVLPHHTSARLTERELVAEGADAFPPAAAPAGLAASDAAAAGVDDLKDELGQRVRYFSLGGSTIMSLIEQYTGPMDGAEISVGGASETVRRRYGGARVALVLRSAAGKFVWAAREVHDWSDTVQPAHTASLHRELMNVRAGVSSSRAARSARLANAARAAAAATEPDAASASEPLEPRPPAALTGDQDEDPLLALLSKCAGNLVKHTCGEPGTDDVVDRTAPPPPPGTRPAVAAAAAMNVDVVSHTEGSRARFSGLEGLLALQQRAETDAPAAPTPDSAAEPAAAPETKSGAEYADGHYFQLARRFLASMGLVALSHHGMMQPLRPSSDLMADLARLDASPTRHQLAVAVHYVSSRVTEDGREVFDHASGDVTGPGSVAAAKDADYAHFLRSMGWWVDLSTHTGFAATLSRRRHAGRLLYYGGYDTEIAFIVSSQAVEPSDALLSGEVGLLEGASSRELVGAAIAEGDETDDAAGDATPASGGDASVRVRKPSETDVRDFVAQELHALCEAAPVQVVWNACAQRYKPGTSVWERTYGLPSTACTLVIDPLPTGLFRVRVYNQTGAESRRSLQQTLGPLTDGTVVGRRVLGRLVRLTAQNAARLSSDVAHGAEGVRSQSGRRGGVATRGSLALQATEARPVVARQRQVDNICSRYSVTPPVPSILLPSLLSREGKDVAGGQTAAA